MSIRRHTLDDELELMSLRRMSDSLEATRAMLQRARQLARESQAALAGLASEFCGAELAKRPEGSGDPSGLPPGELAGMLRGRFKTLKLLSGNGAAFQLAEANRANRELRRELETQRGQASQARGQIQKLEQQVRALERTLEKERRARRERQPSSNAPQADTGGDHVDPEGNEHRSWYTAWQAGNRAWERDTDLIRLVGRSGLSLSTEIEAALVEEKGVSRRTAQRALGECVKAGLLEQESIPSLEGRPPQRCLLTPKGRWLYRELTGDLPQPARHVRLLKAHKSERHLALILKTAERFTQLGFEVEREPLQLEIDEHRAYQPDLVARKDGESFYLEVETGEKEKPGLSRKWENALAAGGRICVVADNLNTLRRIQGDIARWSRFEGHSVALYLTCLSVLKERQAGESPWYAVKEYEPG
jgi:hypothetical protein